MKLFLPKQAILVGAAQVLVTGEVDGLITNAPPLEDAALAQQLRDTPATIPNPDYAPLVEQAFAKAIEAFNAQQAALAN